MKRATLILVLLTLLGCEASRASEEPTSFCRFVPGARNGEGELQTAIASYENEKGIEVSLVSVVHIGDAAYYDTLENYFEDRDAVLYELIARPGDIPQPGRKSSNMVSLVQRSVTSVLELEFQLDAVDYRKENFVHADLDPKKFLTLQKERGESLFSLMLKLFIQEWKQAQKGQGSELTELHLLAALLSDDHARSLKFLLARELQRLEGILAGLDENGDGEGSVIVTDRNRAAMRVLDQELKRGRKKLCIFYGAAHMPDFESRLLDRGFRKTGHRWVTAWDVRSKAEERDGNVPERPVGKQKDR